MTNAYHAIVWIDHQQAKIFQFEGEEVESTTVDGTYPHQHIHHKANAVGSGHAPVDKAFLERVAERVSKAGTLLIAGSASAKQELVAYLSEKEPAIAARIASVQPIDHPTDAQLVSFARRFFRADDRMRSQSRPGMHQ